MKRILTPSPQHDGPKDLSASVPQVFDIPVVLIAFNRPDLTRLTLDRIREVAPSRFFMIVDGPRPGEPEDAARCAAVREVLADPGWPCVTDRRFSAANLGCEANIELGLDWVFQQVDRAIILEDDCVPDLSFFPFCRELLDRYENNDRVMQIAGNALFLTPKSFRGTSYAFSAFGSVWGWATWGRAWDLHRTQFPRGRELAGTQPPNIPVDRLRPNESTLISAAGRRYFRDVATSTIRNEFSWDSYWWLSMVHEGGLAVTPAVNMVQNRGFRADATYTQSSRPSPAADAMAFPLRHPSMVEVNDDVERELERVLVRAAGRMARRAKRLVPIGPIRRPLRAVADMGSWLAARLRMSS